MRATVQLGIGSHSSLTLFTAVSFKSLQNLTDRFLSPFPKRFEYAPTELWEFTNRKRSKSVSQ